MDGNLVETNEEKAEIFGEYFEQKIKNITNTTQPNLNQAEERKLINGRHEDNWITTENTKTIMANLPNKRCSGYDRIPVIFYKDGMEILLPIVTDLMKKIFSEKIVPEQWKIAKVIPVFKKGDKKEPGNYRPISNLCSITKIFERLILERLKVIEKLEKCDLTGESQHGFKSNRSTETACIELQSKISEWCDRGEFVTMTSLDLTAAFDVVNHNLLKRKLQQIGLPKIITDIISEWLTERQFYCEIKGKTSTLRQITHGTVQGSILGPVLFAIFMRGIGDQTEHVTTFADDNFVLNHHRLLVNVVQLAVDSTTTIKNWLVSNGMKVNDLKTEICIFHKKEVHQIEAKIDENIIRVLNKIRVLGIIFDSKLNWYEHTKHAMSKANKAKQGLSLIRKYFNQEEMLKLATAYFYSTLYYGAKVWLMSTLHSTIKKQLWQASSYMLLIVEGKIGNRLSFEKLHKKYNRASPMMWCNYVTAMAMWEVVNNQLPEKTHLKLALNILHEERRPGLLITRNNDTKMGFNCLSNRLQVVSKSLKVNWQYMSKINFKSLCKKQFITEVYQVTT